MEYNSMVRLLVLIFLACMLASAATAQQGGSEGALVEQFFPEELTKESESYYLQEASDPFRVYAYSHVDLDGSGKADYIVAAYSNGVSGAVRVLKKEGQSVVLVAAPSFPLMGGVFPEVTLLDVDGNSRPEVIVRFSTGRGHTTADWILRWDGETLESIAPVVNGATFVDLTGDGALDVVSSVLEGEDIFLVYSLQHGRYQRSGALYLFETFRRSSGIPVAEVKEFAVQNPDGQYLMTIVNRSEEDGLVSSARIILNGAVVASPEQFNRQVKVLKIPVTVATLNTLEVTLFGAPGLLLSIGIGEGISVMPEN